MGNPQTSQHRSEYAFEKPVKMYWYGARLNSLIFINGEISISPQITSNDTTKLNKTSRDPWFTAKLTICRQVQPISTFTLLCDSKLIARLQTM